VAVPPLTILKDFSDGFPRQLIYSRNIQSVKSEKGLGQKESDEKKEKGLWVQLPKTL